MNTPPALPACPTDNKIKKRKSILTPRPLPRSKIPKNRFEARAASKVAKIVETVDLLSQCNSGINVLQDITFMPTNTAVQQPQTETTSIDELPNNTEELIPLTQSVIDTIFENTETSNALEAFMVSLDAADGRPPSPDIFQEPQDQFKVDTLNFIQEKIALLQTRINISEDDIKGLKAEESILNRKLYETRSILQKKERYLIESENNLKKFEVFRDAL